MKLIVESILRSLKIGYEFQELTMNLSNARYHYIFSEFKKIEITHDKVFLIDNHHVVITITDKATQNMLVALIKEWLL